MAQKVLKCGIKRKKGFLYYIDKKGNVAEAKMARGKKKGGGSKVIVKCGIQKKPGFLYFIDKSGDVSMAKMVRGGRKKKRKKRR
jgi:hypothetical protein